MNPEYFQARQEKLLPTALSLEQPNIRKQSPSSKQSAPEPISPSEGVRACRRGLSPPTPETAGFQASGSQPVVKWNPKDLYIGVSTVQVTGNPKGTSVGKEAAPSQVRPREPMSVLMMANREVVNTELGSYRDSADNEDCSQPMDDIQVSAEEVSPQRLLCPPQLLGSTGHFQRCGVLPPVEGWQSCITRENTGVPSLPGPRVPSASALRIRLCRAFALAPAPQTLPRISPSPLPPGSLC